MAVTLNTNIPSLATINSLNKTTNKLTKSYERFSSGLKINKAGDDAAGLVISKKMEISIEGFEQAQKNILTAKNYLTIADDTMSSISEHFGRISDLLVGAANGTNDVYPIATSADEIIERLAEIDRLVDSTDFNGRIILDGSIESLIIQVGTDSSDLSQIDIAPALTDCHVAAFGAELPDNLNPESPDFNPNNENCRAYLQVIHDAIDIITANRGLLGAYENRTDSAYKTLTTRIENLKEAKIVYTDTDVAQEATNLTTQQILEQINIAILSSANTAPQTALSLLGA